MDKTRVVYKYIDQAAPHIHSHGDKAIKELKTVLEKLFPLRESLPLDAKFINFWIDLLEHPFAEEQMVKLGRALLTISGDLINHPRNEHWRAALDVMIRRSREWVQWILHNLPNRQEVTEIKTEVSYQAVGVLTNATEVDELKNVINAHDVTSKIMHIVPNSIMAAMAVANLLGNLPDELNNQIVVQSRLIPRLMIAFNNCLEEKISEGPPAGSTASIWLWPEDVCIAVISLCQNDQNKILLGHAGFIPLLVRVLKQDNIPEYSGSSVVAQRFRAARALWLLAFKSENHPALNEAGAEQALQDLRNCKDKNTADNDGRRAAYGALMQMGKIPIVQEKAVAVAELALAATATAAAHHEEVKVQVTGHVMLSYNWGSQALVIALRDTLQHQGFTVWMDVNEMHGSTLEAMGQAVESCSAFLMCMSQQYKQSPNCRAEAEYAFATRKHIIPVLVENGYKADGWMGPLLGSKLWYDISPALTKGVKGDKVDGEVVNKVSVGLVRELKKHVTSAGSPTGGAPATPASPKAAKDHAYMQWSPAEVRDWVEHLGYPSQAQTFVDQAMNGLALDELRLARELSLDVYLRCLRETLGFQQLGCALSFSRQLQHLPDVEPSTPTPASPLGKGNLK